jgi:hypothetical protein
VKGIQKLLAIGKKVDFQMCVVLHSEFVAQKRHLLLIKSLIFYYGYLHNDPLVSLVLL